MKIDIAHSTLTPMQLGRLNKCLDQRYVFRGAGVRTMREFLRDNAETLGKKITDHSAEYSRARFNAMNQKEQDAYKERLARPCYNVTFGDGYVLEVAKIIYDALV